MSSVGPPVVQADTFDTADGTTVDGWDVELGNNNAGTLTFHDWATCVNQTIQIPG